MGFLDRLLGRRRAHVEPDAVWRTRQAKMTGVWRRAKAESETAAVLLLAQFRDTFEALCEATDEPFQRFSYWSQTPELFTGGAPPSVGLFSELGTMTPTGHPGEGALFVCVAERHPRRANDDALVEVLANLAHPVRVEFHLSLEDAILQRFVGERLAPLLDSLGMKEDEAIRHAMVARAIRNAQKKIGGRAGADRYADSAEQWLEAHVPD